MNEKKSLEKEKQKIGHLEKYFIPHMRALNLFTSLCQVVKTDIWIPFQNESMKKIIPVSELLGL